MVSFFMTTFFWNREWIGVVWCSVESSIDTLWMSFSGKHGAQIVRVEVKKIKAYKIERVIGTFLNELYRR